MFENISDLLSWKNILYILVLVIVGLFILGLFTRLFKKEVVEGLTPIGSTELENLVKRIKTANITEYDTLLMDKYRNNWEDLIFVVEEAIHIMLFKNLQAISQGYMSNMSSEELAKIAERGNIYTGYLDTLNKQIKYLDTNVPIQK
jgi:hypothetical protein